MNDETLEALRQAVNIARFEQVKTIAVIRVRLGQRGHSKEAIDAAIKAWAHYEKVKP